MGRDGRRADRGLARASPPACAPARRRWRRTWTGRWSEVLRGEDDAWLERLDVVQPALFAVMVSLAGLWRACGVEPAAVVGHSQGEIAAAHVAGALSLEDAARVVALRARAMATIAGRGGMLWSRAAGRSAAARGWSDFDGRVSLAAINGPASLVVSGEPEALAELAESCKRDGLQTRPRRRRLRRPLGPDRRARGRAAGGLRADRAPRRARSPSTRPSRGGLLDGGELGPDYWFRNLRQTVLFDPALRALLERGSRAFVEMAPHPVLAFGVRETFDDVADGAAGAAVFGALRRDDGGPARFALSLAEAHAHGVRARLGRGLRRQRGQAGVPAHLPVPAPALLAGDRRRRFGPTGARAGAVRPPAARRRRRLGLRASCC